MAVTRPAPADALAALAYWADVRPRAIAVRTTERVVEFDELRRLVSATACVLAPYAQSRCAFLMENGLGWIVADLAARQSNCVVVPIPAHFSDHQIRHVIDRGGIELIITDSPGRVFPLAATLPHQPPTLLGEDPDLSRVHLLRTVLGVARPLPPGTRKLTFTSGTTGQPKGVCLSDEMIDRVAHSLLVATEGNSEDRHLSLLPYAALLENIAAIDVSLMAGAEICAPSVDSLGFRGSSALAVKTLVAALEVWRPTSIVTVPQILLALVASAQATGWRPTYLRHVAVGGATLSKGSIERAREVALPAFEGYGLSECASVITLNTRENDRPGSVGRPLPHCQISIAEDGEVLVSGAQAVGYLDTEGEAFGLGATHTATGDIGRIDSDGYLYLLGRKKEVFISAFGRNVAPGWVECELTAMPLIAQAIVIGEARPWNVAIIVLRSADAGSVPEKLVAEDISRVNARLPDYAQIRQWLVADEPFLPSNGLATWNGRLRREQIVAVYRDRIECLFQEDVSNVH